MTVEICRICGSDEVSVLYNHAKDYLTGYDFQVVSCANCQVAYTLPRPSDMTPFYPAKYRRYVPFVLQILKTLYRYRVKRWAKNFDEPGFAFEMGCGDGLMLHSLKTLGWKVLGNERTPTMAYFARHHLGLDVFVGELDVLHAVPQFDLIVLFQVLEHLDDPIKILGQLSKLLKPSGRIVIGVPNFRSWQSQFGKTRWFHLDIPRHLFHYSPISLNNCLNQVGMEIEKIDWVSFEHDPYGWLQTILNRLDTCHNRLTRLLMKIDRLNLVSALHLAIAPVLGIACVLLSILSWILGQGAMLEVTARHKPIDYSN